MIKFIKSFTEPDPREYTYWVDLTADEHMSVIKYYDGNEWVRLNKELITDKQLEVINNLTSTDKDKALSALLGKILNDTINTLLTRIKVLENALNKLNSEVNKVK